MQLIFSYNSLSSNDLSANLCKCQNLISILFNSMRISDALIIFPLFYGQNSERYRTENTYRFSSDNLILTLNSSFELTLELI